MKYLVKIFVVTIAILFSTHSIAEQKIVTLDMKFVLNNSKAGKGAQDYLKKTFKKNQDNFTQREKDLKKEEEDLLAKKKILEKDEYSKKSSELRKKISAYREERRSSLEKISNQRIKAKELLDKEILPILSKYIEANDIAFVFDKRYTLGGKSELDITNIIIVTNAIVLSRPRSLYTYFN